jgi:transcriptional regulator with XRE-family HTH domain
VPDVRSPTLRRRELGGRLRALRMEKGLTVEQVAELLLCSPSKVSRMETGQRGATLRDIRDLTRIYEVTDEEQVARMVQLAKEGKQQGRWQSFTVPLKYTNYIEFEQEATSLTVFYSSVVPGLVQTADYTRAVHENALPRLEAAAIEERVAERKTRQQILTRNDPPNLTIILDEAVVRRLVGGPLVMREQLSRLIKEGERPAVTLQLLPYEVGAHPALESNFTILEFADQAPVIYVEGLVGHIYLERQEHIEHYLRVVEKLRSMALSPQDSAELLAKIRDVYTSEQR